MKQGGITVVGTTQTHGCKYFLRGLKSVMPIADLLSWHLNIAGERRGCTRDLVKKRWDDALITTDDNKKCTYDLISAQLESLPDDALVYPWTEDVWFVCPHIDLFLYVLDKFIQSQAEVMPASHLITVWEEQGLRTPVVSNRFYSEYLIDLPSQEQVWEELPGSYWVISIPSIFKIGLFREVVEYQKEDLSQSCKPHGLELPPEAAKGFLADRSFIRLVPHFHVFREVVDFAHPPRRCLDWYEACEMVDLRDFGGKFGGFPNSVNHNHDAKTAKPGKE